MKISSRNKPDQLNIVHVAIDFLLYLFLGGLLFFLGPLFIILFIHSGRRSRHEISDVEANILTYLYDKKLGIVGLWIGLGAIFGVLFAILMVIRKLRKLHLTEIVVRENDLMLTYVSLNGKTAVKEIPLTEHSIKITVQKDTDDADPCIEVLEATSGNRLLSTKKSKYWEYKHDSKNLLDLRDELKRRNFLIE